MAKRFETATKALNAKVESVIQGANQMRDIIVDLCPAIVGNAIDTGDVRIATKFVNGLPSDVFDRPQLVRWFEAHGPFSWVSVKELNVSTGKEETIRKFEHKAVSPEIELSYKGDKEAHMKDLAEVTPAFKPVDANREFEGFDLKQAIHNLLKRAEKVAADDDKRGHEKTDLAGLESLKDLDKRLQGKTSANSERGGNGGGRGGRREQPAEAIPFEG